MSTDKQPLVLHVIHHLVIGGMENGLVNLINRMPCASFRHTIVCIENYSEFRRRIVQPGVDVIALNRSRVGIWAVRRELFRLCRTMSPAIVHSRNMSGLDALIPARLAGVPFCVHSEHGRDVDDLRGDKWNRLLLRRIHRPFIHRYITVSKDLERYVVNLVGIPAPRVVQIYNGVDTNRFSPADEKPTGILPESFVGKDKIIIGTVGRLQRVKDFSSLIRAFAQLRQRFPGLAPRAYLAIVGDGPLKADLHSLVQSLGIEERVWMPGATENVPDVLRSFDIFVLSSLWEGISNTILEAMASRLPVVATAVGGNLELVDNGQSGRLFQPGDVDSLVNCLVEYLSSNSLRKAHADAARRIAVERFSIDTMVAKYLEVYKSLLAAQT